MSARDPGREQELTQRLLRCEELRLSLGGVSSVCHCVDDEDSWKTEYAQLPELLDENFKATKLLNLKKLSIRNFEVLPDASALLWECLHVHQLTELNLEKNNLKLLCNDLQFWTLPNLTSLNLNRTYLPFLPASIGRLQQLKTLSLNNNHLKTLPHTLSFCTSLEELNLEYNRFSVLPGVILQIPSLKTLRRYGNYDLHTGAADLAASARRNRYIAMVHEQVRLEEEELGEVVPLKLLAVQSIMTHRIDYWKDGSLAPAVCKILDMSQTEYKICDKCWTAMPLSEPGYYVRWLVESFLGLRHVPFEHFACRMECARFLEGQFKTIQAKDMDRHDEEYRAMVEQYAAMEEQDSHSGGMRVVETWKIDLPDLVTVNDRWGWHFHPSDRQRHKCSVI